MSYTRLNKRKYHFIYKTTCSITGNYYLGMHSTDNLDDDYLGSGRRLRNSIRKHGEENHVREIIEFCNTREDLAKREAEIVNLNEIAKQKCMNLCLGGWGGFISIEGYKKGAKKMNEIINLRKKSDPDFLERCKIASANGIRKAHKEGKIPYGISFVGKQHSEETKQKMRDKASQRVGDKNSQYGTCWITNGLENKKIKKTDTIPDGWKLGRRT
jgi:hypothetical protein